MTAIREKLRAFRERAVKGVTEFFAGRMSVWLWISVGLTVAVIAIAPILLGATLVKVLAVTVGGWIGYWFDRAMFPYARPDCYLQTQDWIEHRDKVGKVEGVPDYPVIDTYHMLFAVAQIRRTLLAGFFAIAAALAI